MDTELASYTHCQSAWGDIATADPSRPPYQYDLDASDFGNILQSDGTETFSSKTLKSFNMLMKYQSEYKIFAVGFAMNYEPEISRDFGSKSAAPTSATPRRPTTSIL